MALAQTQPFLLCGPLPVVCGCVLCGPQRRVTDAPDLTLPSQTRKQEWQEGEELFPARFCFLEMMCEEGFPLRSASWFPSLGNGLAPFPQSERLQRGSFHLGSLLP